MDLNQLIKKLEKDALSNCEIAYLMERLKRPEPDSELNEILGKAWKDAERENIELDSDDIFKKVLEQIIEKNEGYLEPSKSGIVSAKRKTPLGKYRDLTLIFVRYAAVILLSFGLFCLIKPFSTKPSAIQYLSQSQSVEVPYGSKSKVELPDGSIVILNSGSRLSYTTDGFNSEKRNVNLEGEGFFNVVKDSVKPFYVRTQGMLVKVLGTTFNLKSYSDETTEEATLVNGSLQIYVGAGLNEKGEALLLRPNDKAVFNKLESEPVKQKISSVSIPEARVELRAVELQNDSKMEQVISWKNNRLIFDNEPFETLLIKIERWYDVNFIVNYPELRYARFSGKFDKETVEQVMNALASITPFHFEISRNQITIMKK